MDIGTKVQIARERAGLTQDQLGKIVGLSQQGIAKIERGETRKPRGISKIAAALGINAEWLEYDLNPPKWFVGVYSPPETEYPTEEKIKSSPLFSRQEIPKSALESDLEKQLNVALSNCENEEKKQSLLKILSLASYLPPETLESYIHLMKNQTRK